jgi:hypothetical protein
VAAQVAAARAALAVQAAAMRAVPVVLGAV